MPDQRHARLAAEAAFAKRPVAPVSDQGQPMVVVKRKRAIVLSGIGDPTQAGSQEPIEPIEQARTSRVFRVDSPVVRPDRAVEGSAQSSATEASLDVNAVGLDSVPAQVVRKRRRRMPHGEVTIIRPAHPSAPATNDSDPVRRRERLLEDLKALEPALAAPRGEQGLHLGNVMSGPSRYQALKAKIRKLEERAEAARNRERDRAIRWIKEAVAAYGLSASDIGF